MSVATKDTKYYDTSKVQRLPFINLDPSSPSTIYTALCTISWVLAMPACGHISDAVEQYAGVSSATSEQHIYLRESRKVRDKSDVDNIID